MEKIRGKRLTSYTISILMALLLVAALIPNHMLYGEDKDSTEVRIKQHSPELEGELDAEQNAEANTVNSFQECSIFGIKKLIRDYYDAYLLEDDTELMKYIDTVGDLDEEQRNFQRINMEQMMGIRCYYTEGYVEGSYLVISYGYAKYYNINATVPVVGKFLVRRNSSGNYYICNSVVSNESSAYSEIMFESSQAQELYEMAQYELDTACEVDQKLNDFVTAYKEFFVY